MEAPVAYFTLNKTGNIIELNQAAADMLGIPIQFFRYTSIFPYLHEDTKNDFSNFFKNVFKSKKKEYGDIVFKNISGNQIFATLSTVSYFDDKLKENLARCIVTDLNKIKRYEEELKKNKKLNTK